MKSFLSLRISGIYIDVDMISEQFGKPHYTYKKGQEMMSKFNEKADVYDEDCCIYSTESTHSETAEMCLNRFLKTILPKSKLLKSMSEIYNITLWISIYPDDEQNNFHISKDSLKAIYNMGITLDISTYFLKEFYE